MLREHARPSSINSFGTRKCVGAPFKEAPWDSMHFKGDFHVTGSAAADVALKNLKMVKKVGISVDTYVDYF